MEKSLFINGQWSMGEGETLSSYSPFNQEVVWEKKTCSTKQLSETLDSSTDAFRKWSETDSSKRLNYIKNFESLLKENAESIAKTISIETGKLLYESKQEVAASIAKIAISIEAYEERTPKKSWSLQQNQFHLVHKPHGVIAVYAPFNFPFHLPNGHIVPALLAGNCVILKPSEHTPMVAEAMIELWEKAGLPKGVISLLQGTKELAVNLAASNDINGLFFTGSVETGLVLSKQFGATPERILALELGGNNPLIYSSSSDIKAAIYTTLCSAFISSGQRCTCARRLIIVNSSTSSEFLNGLLQASKSLKISSSFDDNSAFMGPVVSKQSASQVMKWQQRLIDLGAKPLLEAKVDSENPCLVSCGIIDTSDIDAPDEECFGPILQVKRVNTFSEALEEAKKTRYGLAGGIITENDEEFLELRQKLKAGIINKNTPTTGASSKAPFGGVGVSGNHRPSAYYAADYCAYPCVSSESTHLTLPETTLPGISL
ncbi:MAG: succinylglutamate-semialdehyde dehydrogenase [Chlamydiales bacterium]|nr:succinylglutamate-semialdehyde dehydrogenase [Chlamydiales bacterium]NCF71191.1 succinylglutamate-semialdehyde dehydrogenase [Chlamydiales bacterium]